MRHGLSFVCALVAGLSVACGGSPASDGAAPGDADPRDVASDAGLPPNDTRVDPDAAAAPDTAAALDAATDASETDGAPWSAALIEPARACTDLVDAIYLPHPLPTMTDAARGDVVGCARDVELDASAVDSAMSASGVTVDFPAGAVRLLRIAYRTYRADGVEGTSSARVYLPVTPRPGPLPVLVVAHPTEGLAPGCTPSRNLDHLRDLALPWAAKGYAVIAPDFAGLGTVGVQGYLDNHDTAHSVLDAARALRKLLHVGALSDQVALIGFSQGGGAVLSAQALAGSYGCDGTPRAVVAFAPQWPTRLNSFAFVDLLRAPDSLTIASGITNPVVAVMRTYSWFANYVGASSAGDGFDTGLRGPFVDALQTLCLKPLGGEIQGYAPHLGDLLDGALRESLLACIDDDTSAKCTGAGKRFHAWLRGNVVHADPKGAPILYVQGLADWIMPPGSEAACNVAALEADGVTPQICADGPAQHTDVVARNVGFAIHWVEAVLAGSTPPRCEVTTLPACTP